MYTAIYTYITNKILSIMSKLINVIHTSTSAQIPCTMPASGLHITYWDIRGLCQPIRLALAYAKVEYTDVRIDAGNPAETDTYKKVWFDVKPEVGKTVKFVNLPYLMDGDNKVAISQSQAILRYIGRKFDLLGKSEVTTDVLLSEVYDFDSIFTRMCYSNFGQMKGYCENSLPGVLDKFAEQLVSCNNTFITGEEISIVDFKFYDLLTKWKIVEADESISTNKVLSNKDICDYIERMENIDAIKQYITSDIFLSRPLNNPHATFK